MADPIDELRGVVTALPPPAPELAGYLAKVRERAYAITDADIDALKEHFDEHEIFEQTVAAAVGEGLRRLDRASDVIR